MSTLRSIVFWSTVVAIGHLLLVFATYATFVVFATLDSIRRARELRAEDLEAMASSRFTLPVSVILPVHDEARVLRPVLGSLLGLSYPEFEVVVVNDGSTDETLDLLRATYGLVPRETFHRRLVPSELVNAIYKSETEPRLTVVDKVNGGKADALNAGLNLVRYPYVCCVDGDTIYHADALVKAMRPAARDPEAVVGVTSQVTVASRPERNGHGADATSEDVLDRTLLSNFQHLEYLRSFLNNRLAWSRLRFMLCTSGAFSIWRRDVLERLGGFSRDFSCEDIEVTFRAHEWHLREGVRYEIVSLPEPVATTEVPDRIWSLVTQRARWQRAMLETVWHYRRMFFNPRYRVVGTIGLPFYTACEVLAPLFEALAIVGIALAIPLGLFTWPAYVVFFAMLSLANATLSAAAILLEDYAAHSYRLRHLVRLLLLSPFELIAYRPLLIAARLRGTLDFLRGRRGWQKFERNHRLEAA